MLPGKKKTHPRRWVSGRGERTRTSDPLAPSPVGTRPPRVAPGRFPHASGVFAPRARPLRSPRTGECRPNCRRNCRKPARPRHRVRRPGGSGGAIRLGVAPGGVRRRLRGARARPVCIRLLFCARRSPEHSCPRTVRPPLLGGGGRRDALPALTRCAHCPQDVLPHRARARVGAARLQVPLRQPNTTEPDGRPRGGAPCDSRVAPCLALSGTACWSGK